MPYSEPFVTSTGLRVLARGVVIVALAGLAACDTQDELSRQRIEAVRRERAMLASFSEALKRGDFSAAHGSVVAFISTKTVNDALAGLEGVKVELPDTSGAVLTIGRIAAAFRTGFPSVIVDATVERSGVKASASVAAVIEAGVDAENPQVLFLKVHVDGLVPKVTWGPFDFAVRGFVRDLAQVKLDELVNGPRVIGTVSIPLARQFALSLPGFSIGKTVPGADVNIDTPPLSLMVKTRVDHIIFLQDGIHVFGTATV